MRRGDRAGAGAGGGLARLLRLGVRLYDGFVAALAVLAAAIIVAIVLAVCIDVVARYAFRRPLGWPIDYSEYGLVAMTFLAMAWLVRQGGHVRIDLMLNALPEPLRRATAALAYLVAAAVCAACAWFALQTAITQYGRGSMTTAIHAIPRYWMSAIIAFGLALTAIELCRAVVAEAFGGRRP